VTNICDNLSPPLSSCSGSGNDNSASSCP